MTNLFVVYAECIIQKGETFLFIKRPTTSQAGGLYCFPGGKVDNEDGDNNSDVLLYAVKREIKEEVGLNLLDPISLVSTVMFEQINDGKKVIGVTFYCNLNITDPTVVPSPREVPEYKWMTLEDALNNEICADFAKRSLLDLKQKLEKETHSQ